jgi:hypothetical protein
MSMASLMGQVKGGGRLYHDGPLSGYTEEEMVAEAQQRLSHNRQRRRLKQLLGAASEDGSTVATKDLLLAAKLAKMELPEEMIADTPYATGIDRVGVPTKIAWKPFYSNLPPPALRGPGGFGDLPPLRKKMMASAASIDAGPGIDSPVRPRTDSPARAETPARPPSLFACEAAGLTCLPSPPLPCPLHPSRLVAEGQGRSGARRQTG